MIKKCPTKIKKNIKKDILSRIGTKHKVVAGDNVFLPVNPRLKTVQATFNAATRYVSSINSAYNDRVTSVDASKQDGTGINIHPSDTLVNMLALKEFMKEGASLDEAKRMYAEDIGVQEYVDARDNERAVLEEMGLTGQEEDLGFSFKQLDKDERRKSLKGLEQEVKTIINSWSFGEHQMKILEEGSKAYKSYAEAYKIRNKGKELNAIGLADLALNTIAMSKDRSGDTLLEEALHFVVAGLWDSKKMKELVGIGPTGISITDDTWLKETKEYKQHYKIYEEAYKGDTVAATQEVVTKILTNYVYSMFKRKLMVPNPKVRAGINALEKFFRAFFDKIRVWLNINTKQEIKIASDRAKILNTFASDFLANKLSIDISKLSKEFIADPVNEKLNVERELISAMASSIQTRLKAVRRRLITSRNKQERYDYATILTKWNLLPNNNLRDHIVAEIKVLTELSKKQELSTLQKERLADYSSMINTLLPFIEAENTLDTKIKKLLRVEHQLMGAERLNKVEEALIAYLVGVETVDPNTGGITLEGGVLVDLEELSGIMDKFDKLKVITSEEYHLLASFSEYYSNVLKKLKTSLEKHDNFPSLTKEGIEAAHKAIDDVNRINTKVASFLKVQAVALAKINLMEYNPEYTPEEAGRLAAKDKLVQRSFLARITSSIKNSRNPLLQEIYDIVTKTNFRIERETVEIANKLMDVYNKIAKPLHQNDTFKKYLKKYNTKTIDSTLIEYDKDGKQTQYFKSGYKIAEHEKNQREFEQALLEEAKQFYKQLIGQAGLKHQLIDIPEGRDQQSLFERNKWLNAAYVEDEAVKKARYAVRKMIKRSEAAWYSEHTIPVEHWEDEVRMMKIKLSKAEFGLWTQKNITWYTDATGQVRRSPRGSLVTPSDGRTKRILVYNKRNGLVQEMQGVSHNYIDEDYKELSEIKEWKEYYDAIIDVKKQAIVDHLGIEFSSSGNHMYRRPNMTKTTRDIHSDLTVGQVISKEGREDYVTNIGNKLGDGFILREDDDLVSSSDQSVAFKDKSPPIRYVAPQEKPEILTQDFIFAVSAFHEMANTYSSHLKNMEKYVNIASMVQQQEFYKTRSQLTSALAGTQTETNRRSRGQAIEGIDSTDYQSLQSFIDHQVFEQNLISSIGNKNIDEAVSDFDKIKLKTAWTIKNNFIQGVGLLFNIAGWAAGFGAAQVLTTMEGIVGKDVTVKSLVKADKELFKRMVYDYSSSGIPRVDSKLFAAWHEFGNPKKYSKSGQIVQALGIHSAGAEAFKNSNKNKHLNRFFRAIGYGGWDGTDYFTKTRMLTAVFFETRKINGVWTLRYDHFANGGTKEDWKSAENDNLWDAIAFEGEQLKFPEDFTEKMKDKVTHLVTHKTEIVDGQLNPMNKADVHRHFVTMLFATFRNFLIINMNRLLKKEHEFKALGRKEAGILNVYMDIMSGKEASVKKRAAFSGLSLLFPPFVMYNVIQALRSYDSFEYHEQQAIKEGVGIILSVIATYIIKEIVTGLAEDDKEDNWWIQLLGLVGQRIYMETSSSVSPGELIQLLDDPIPGLSLFFGVGKEMAAYKDGSYKVKSGIYEDADKRWKAIIKRIPGVKHLYEQWGLGYHLNGVLPTSIVGNPNSPGVGIGDKRQWYDKFITSEKASLMQAIGLTNIPGTPWDNLVTYLEMLNPDE